MSIDNFEAIVAKLAKLEIHNVFPVGIFRNAEGNFEKRPLERWKKFQFRSPTREEAKRMMRRHRYVYAAGIPTGGKFFVIDADNSDAIEYLEKRGMPETWVVRTRRGVHYYLRTPADLVVKNSAGKIYAGIDLRGLGGYVVSPYSSFQTGARFHDRFFYHWDEGASPADVPLASPPDWLLAELRAIEERKRPTSIVKPKSYRGTTSSWARAGYQNNLERLASAGNGTRNATLFDVSRRLGQLVAGGELDQAEVLENLHAIAEPWKEGDKSRDTIARGFAIGFQQPHGRPISTAA